MPYHCDITCSSESSVSILRSNSHVARLDESGGTVMLPATREAAGAALKEPCDTRASRLRHLPRYPRSKLHAPRNPRSRISRHNCELLSHPACHRLCK